MIQTSIKVRDKKYLVIRWDDNSETNIKLPNLRWNCPCAECSTERIQKGSSYIPIYSFEQVTITNIRTIGNYAIGISWQDGHAIGIYDFNYLKLISNS